MIKWIINYFRKEIQSTIEYYQEGSSDTQDDMVIPYAEFNEKKVPASALKSPRAQKDRAAQLIKDAKYYADEVNKSTTVFDFKYSYEKFRMTVEELIYLNEKKTFLCIQRQDMN